MCLYTYHHYPACGHISNWTVTSCKEYTNALRLLSRAGLSGSCDQVHVTHDLLCSSESNICSLCDLELSSAASHYIFDGFRSKNYRAIECLDSKGPIVEISARMNVDVNDEEVAGCGCDCCSCFTSSFSSDDETHSSGGSPNGKIPSPAVVANVSQYLDDLEDSDDLSMDHGSSAEDISPSWTQLDARSSRNSLHCVIPIGTDRASDSLERQNTEHPYTWLDSSDGEPGLAFSDDSDDSSVSDNENEVQHPNSLTFLDDDSDADDESDGGCELTNKFADDYADVLSPLPLLLLFNKAKKTPALERLNSANGFP